MRLDANFASRMWTVQTDRRISNRVGVVHAYVYAHVLMSVLTAAGVATVKSVDVGLFLPETCGKLNAMFDVTETISRAKDEIRSRNGEVQVNFVKYNSCDIKVSLFDMMNVVSNDSVAAMIGPGYDRLCEYVNNLAEVYLKPIIMWSCVRELHRSDMTAAPIARTTATVDKIASSLVKILTHFRWQKIAVASLHAQPWTAMCKEISLFLARAGFTVADQVVLHVSTLRSANRTAPSLFEDSLTQDTKALVLCMDFDLVNLTLDLAKQQRSLLDLAVFLPTHYDTDMLLYMLNRGSHPPSNDTLQSLFLLSSQTTAYKRTGVNLARRRRKRSLVRRPLISNLYNAMILAAEAIDRTAKEGLDPLSAKSFIKNMQNVTVNGLNGLVEVDPYAHVQNDFVLLDFKPTNQTFQPVLYVTRSEELSVTSSISWPNGISILPDECFHLRNCSETKSLSLPYVIVIILVVVVLTGCAFGVVWYIRHFIRTKEMEKGPNKIVLSHDDLVFVQARTFSKSTKNIGASSQALEKPDLLKASEPAKSFGNISEEMMDLAENARYNGDIVHLKRLEINSFEVKGKVMNLLKQLRDVRHENLNPFVGIFVDPQKPSIITEYCSRGSLEDIIHDDNIKLDWSFKLSLLTDLVRGMRYIHSSPLRQHGYLKSGNCVIDSRWVLKVTDYGLPSLYEKYQIKRKRKAKDLLWTAPEHLREPTNEMYKGSQKGDVYSFAITMQELILRGAPYCMLELGADEIIKKVRKPPPLCRPSVSQQAAPPQYVQMMKTGWSEMPDMRPDFDCIYQQFKEINKGKKMNIVDTMFNMLEKYSNDLEDIVRERTTQLAEEQKKTEQLISKMLPKSVAKNLLIGKPVEAESFVDTTIYFSDIVGFTTISAMSNPMQVVDLLNDLYTMFDATIDNYNVYKVETIGDAYMVVSGLPISNGIRHAGEIGTMALDLLSQCGTFTIRHMPEVPLRLRIGLHTGPCVAGVVGLTMPRYCLFGDTVNTASRMESTGTAFRIHLSQTTKDRLDDLGGYDVDYRGETEVKGKGIMNTYWLVGKEGFTKPLPEPPAISGDNHGLSLAATTTAISTQGVNNKTSTSSKETESTYCSTDVAPSEEHQDNLDEIREEPKKETLTSRLSRDSSISVTDYSVRNTSPVRTGSAKRFTRNSSQRSVHSSHSPCKVAPLANSLPLSRTLSSGPCKKKVLHRQQQSWDNNFAPVDSDSALRRQYELGLCDSSHSLMSTYSDRSEDITRIGLSPSPIRIEEKHESSFNNLSPGNNVSKC